MFEAKFKKAETLKRIVDSVNPLLGAAIFNIKPEGIAMQSMDSGQVTLIQLVLRKQGFEHFRCDKEILIGGYLLNLVGSLCYFASEYYSSPEDTEKHSTKRNSSFAGQ